MQHATASQRIQENYRVIYIEILVRLSIRVLEELFFAISLAIGAVCVSVCEYEHRDFCEW